MGTDLVLVHGIQYKVLLGNKILLELQSPRVVALLTLPSSIPKFNWTFFFSPEGLYKYTPGTG